MISYETYKNNLLLKDEDNIGDIQVSRDVICGDIRTIRKTEEPETERILPLVAAIVGVRNSNYIRDADCLKDQRHIWVDIDQQQKYLNSKPTCFVILGKPGTQGFHLGEELANQLKCLHICPRNVLIDEIKQQSLTGKCLDFNLRHNKVMKANVLLSLVKQKINSPVVKHRGYVLSGFPLVSSNKTLKCLIRSLHGEESLLLADETLYDIICSIRKTKVKRNVDGEEGAVEEEVAEEEEEAVEEEQEEEVIELPKNLLQCCTDTIKHQKPFIVSKQYMLVNQLNEIFGLEMSPDIIIHLTIPDVDIVTKKLHKYVNIKTSTPIVEPIIAHNPNDLRWPLKYSNTNFESPINEKLNLKYCVRPPINFTENSIEQICNYKNSILPLLEKRLKDYNPKHVIRVDARTSVNQMLYQVMQRLQLLPVVQPVLVPELLNLEEPPELEEFWPLVEETCTTECMGVTYNYSPSIWFQRCPVELKKRISTVGKPKYSLKFFKHIYLFSSIDALSEFYINPRPFLNYEYLVPTCRVIICGTKSSGKTTVSQCLSWIFDAPIITYRVILEEEKRKKYDLFAATTVYPEIVGSVEEERLQAWQALEDIRIAALNQWHQKTLSNLTKYVALYKRYLKLQDDIAILNAQNQNNEEEQAPESYYVLSEQEEKLIENYKQLKTMVMFLPFLDDVNACAQVLNEKNVLQYGPPELLEMNKKPKLPVLGDPDVTEAIANYIVANNLQSQVEPTPEALVEAILNIIRAYDEEAKNKNNQGTFYGKYIIDDFPADPEYWNILKELRYLPDHTIALIENRELENEVIEQYKVLNNCYKYHEERYILANDPLINLFKKLQPPRQIDIYDYWKGMLYNIVRTLPLYDVIDPSGTDADFITNDAGNIDKFRENFDSVKLTLEEGNKSVTTVELEGKSDVNVVEEVLKYLRKSYFITYELKEDENEDFDEDDVEKVPNNLLTYNEPTFFGETGVYCPFTYLKYNVLWEGKNFFNLKYNNKYYYFTKEDFLEEFKKDVTAYQSYNEPFKTLPPLRICIIGSIGSGRSTLSKYIAKELGLIHVDFADFINHNLLPRYVKEIGWHYENKFNDEVLDEEALMEQQVGEEEYNTYMPTVQELRLMIYNYFEKCSPLLKHLLQKAIAKLWFEKPFSTTGIVLDGFPRLPSDVEDMVAANCIPDKVIELIGSSEVALERMSSKYFKTWKTQKTEAMKKSKEKFNKAKQDWFNDLTQKIVIKLTLDELIYNCVLTDLEVQSSKAELQKSTADVQPSEAEITDDKLVKCYDELIQKYPEPIDTSTWEADEEAQTRIDSRIENIYETEDENIQTLKELFPEHKIRMFSIDGTISIEKVVRRTLLMLTSLRDRSKHHASFFEETFLMTHDFAKVMLSQGFYFFSNFHRMCPVFIHENSGTVFNPFDQEETVYVVAHRCFIYFIRGAESLLKFRTDPLKYITSNKRNSCKEYPLGIGVIGSPKSGKSTLAGKLAEKYGLICITRGIALRNVLEKFQWTKLAKNIIGSLQNGDVVNSVHIMDALQMTLIDYHTVTRGFILDGIPENASEVVALSKYGIYPLLIFDIVSKKKLVLQRSQLEIYNDILKYRPPFSIPFITYRYLKWKEKSRRVRDHINNDCQNVYLVDSAGSKWQCLDTARNYIKSVSPKVHYFLNNVTKTVVPVDVMCISNEIFEQRMSCFKNMCPVCLFNNTLKNGGYPVDKKGVVQYKDQFFWICSNHMDVVLKNPDVYLKPNEIEIPEIPTVVKNILVSNIHENGVCMVTYAENLPEQRIVTGSNKYAANYQSKIFLFCDQDCLDKFLNKPHLYCDITIFKETSLFPNISLKKMPDLGYLEQTLGEVLTHACCAVNILRPKYPGLSVDVSGLLYVGLYLKIHNKSTAREVVNLYEKAFKKYVARSKLIINIGLRLRSMDNPFVKYPECCRAKLSDSNTVCKPSTAASQSSATYIMLPN